MENTMLCECPLPTMPTLSPGMRFVVSTKSKDSVLTQHTATFTFFGRSDPFRSVCILGFEYYSVSNA